MTDQEYDELEARLRRKASPEVLHYAPTGDALVPDELLVDAADAISTLRAEKAELEGLVWRSELWFSKLENHAKSVVEKGGPHSEHYYTPMLALLTDLRTTLKAALKGKETP